MGSKHIRTDINFAWPSAEIAVMGSQGAVDILYRREIAEAKDKESARRDRINELEEKFANPYVAAERGFIDEVIEPAQTRPKLIPRAGIAGEQARSEPAEETWEHSAVRSAWMVNQANANHGRFAVW
jgi:propionyl-CoA carboxylase beta chain